MDISPRLERLRNAGYKLTTARATVLGVIESHEGHMTSAEILDEVSKRDSSIGRASVFRTLDLLTRLAIIRPTYTSSSATPNYVLMPDGHHHHIVCVQCHQTIEFHDCGLGVLSERLEKELGVKLTGHLLEFYGVCGTCSEVGVVDDEN